MVIDLPRRGYESDRHRPTNIMVNAWLQQCADIWLFPQGDPADTGTA